jgi:DNA-directed RNA polymerase specialized sigma24 family protein
MKAGDREAFDVAMSLLLRQALRSAQHMIRNREDAEDIAQVVISELWRKHATLPEGMAGEVFAERFLTAIAKRRSLEQLRKDLRRKNIADFLSYDEGAVDAARSTPDLGDVVIAWVDGERDSKKSSKRSDSAVTPPGAVTKQLLRA